MGDLNKNLFLRYGSCKSKIRVPLWSGSGKSSLPSFQKAAFLLHPHSREKKGKLSDVPKGLKSAHHKDTTLMTLPKPNYLPKALIAEPTTLGVRASI